MSLNTAVRRSLLASFMCCHDLCDVFAQHEAVGTRMVHILKSTVYAGLFRIRHVETACCASLLLVLENLRGRRRAQTHPHWEGEGEEGEEVLVCWFPSPLSPHTAIALIQERVEDPRAECPTRPVLSSGRRIH